MNKQIFSLPDTGRLICTWVPTGDKRITLACVWIQEGVPGADSASQSSKRRTVSIPLCA